MEYDTSKWSMIYSIKNLMLDYHVSQDELALILGTTQSRISRCLDASIKHAKSEFTITEILKLANHFNIPIEDLVTEGYAAKSQKQTPAKSMADYASAFNLFHSKIPFSSLKTHKDNSGIVTAITLSLDQHSDATSNFLDKMSEVLALPGYLSRMDIFNLWIQRYIADNQCTDINESN